MPFTAVDTFFAEATKTVTGSVQVKLFKGTATALGATSPYSLYSEDLATFGPSAKYDHADSKGFVRLYGLPGMVAASVRRAKGVDGSTSSAAKKAKGSTPKASKLVSVATKASAPKLASKTSGKKVRA